MKSASLFATVLIAGMLAACGGDAEAPGENCATVTGLYRATNFKVDGTEKTTLHKDFLANGGTYQINLAATTFTGVYVVAPGAVPLQVTGQRAYTAGQLQLGSVPLLPGFAQTAQLFTCTVEDNTITLRWAATTYDFGGIGIRDKAAITLSLIRM